MRGKRIILVVCIVLSLAGCATANRDRLPEVAPLHTVNEFSDDEKVKEVADDPWEHFNLTMYRFNYNFDKYVFLPAVKGYEFITPNLVQTGISNFFDNVYEFRTLYNSLFQLNGRKALTTFGRFVTNSTIGIGGLFDVATSLGMKRQYGDFGQTLGYWGVGPGHYLVLPFLGPNTVRSAAGYGIDGGIRYAVMNSVDPFENSDEKTAIEAGIYAVEVTNLRHQEKFRYYESGYPFEYFIVRFLYCESRELMIKK